MSCNVKIQEEKLHAPNMFKRTIYVHVLFDLVAGCFLMFDLTLMLVFSNITLDSVCYVRQFHKQQLLQRKTKVLDRDYYVYESRHSRETRGCFCPAHHEDHIEQHQ